MVRFYGLAVGAVLFALAGAAPQLFEWQGHESGSPKNDDRNETLLLRFLLPPFRRNVFLSYEQNRISVNLLSISVDPKFFCQILAQATYEIVS